MSVAKLIKARLSGKADYADRTRLDSIVLIVHVLDEHETITGIGISLEPVELTNHPANHQLRGDHTLWVRTICRNGVNCVPTMPLMVLPRFRTR